MCDKSQPYEKSASRDALSQFLLDGSEDSREPRSFSGDYPVIIQQVVQVIRERGDRAQMIDVLRNPET